MCEQRRSIHIFLVTKHGCSSCVWEDMVPKSLMDWLPWVKTCKFTSNIWVTATYRPGGKKMTTWNSPKGQKLEATFLEVLTTAECFISHFLPEHENIAGKHIAAIMSVSSSYHFADLLRQTFRTTYKMVLCCFYLSVRVFIFCHLIYFETLPCWLSSFIMFYSGFTSFWYFPFMFWSRAAKLQTRQGGTWHLRSRSSY